MKRDGYNALDDMRVFLRITFWTLAVALFAGGLVYAFWPQPIEVETAIIRRGSMEVTVQEDGRTRIKEKYLVSAPLIGHLRRIEFEAGDPVTAGETLLAAIQPQGPSLLNDRERAQADARVKAAEAAVKRSATAYKAAEAAFSFSDAELQRARAVARNQVISRTELETSEMKYRMRTEELQAARFAQDIAAFELDLARSALLLARPDQSNPDSKTELLIHAPIDGVVLRVYHESAQVVSSGTPLIELGDPKELEVEIDVLSNDAVQIRPGGLVHLEHWGGTEQLQGRVRLVEPAGFTKISALGVEEQRVNVIIDLTSPLSKRTQLGDGFRVEARIVTWTSTDVLQVPIGALFRRGNAWCVFVVQQSRALLRRVKIGHRNETVAEVLDGLEVGELVVLHPSDKLREKSSVREIDPLQE